MRTKMSFNELRSFEKRTNKNGPIVRAELGPCWQWTGAKAAHGYGQLSFFGRCMMAHRISYRHFVGEIPEGYDINHKCENKSCVNPAHIEPMTRKDHLALHIGKECVHGFKPKKRCEKCKEEKKAESLRLKMLKYPYLKDGTCPHGHPIPEENPRVTGTQWHCVICSRESNKRYREEVKAGKKKPRNTTGLVCRRGHPKEGANALWVCGILRCRQCDRASQERFRAKLSATKSHAPN